jgi:hypothetical protein
LPAVVDERVGAVEVADDVPGEDGACEHR